MWLRCLRLLAATTKLWLLNQAFALWRCSVRSRRQELVQREALLTARTRQSLNMRNAWLLRSSIAIKKLSLAACKTLGTTEVSAPHRLAFSRIIYNF